MAGINKEKILSEKRLMAAFYNFDRDGNGLIDISELKEIFKHSGNISDQVYKEMINECLDYNENDILFKRKQVNFKYFSKMMKK